MIVGSCTCALVTKVHGTGSFRTGREKKIFACVISPLIFTLFVASNNVSSHRLPTRAKTRSKHRQRACSPLVRNVQDYFVRLCCASKPIEARSWCVPAPGGQRLSQLPASSNLFLAKKKIPTTWVGMMTQRWIWWRWHCPDHIPKLSRTGDPEKLTSGIRVLRSRLETFSWTGPDRAKKIYNQAKSLRRANPR
jgi:hypothetical protein